MMQWHSLLSVKRFCWGVRLWDLYIWDSLDKIRPNPHQIKICYWQKHSHNLTHLFHEFFELELVFNVLCTCKRLSVMFVSRRLKRFMIWGNVFIRVRCTICILWFCRHRTRGWWKGRMSDRHWVLMSSNWIDQTLVELGSSEETPVKMCERKMFNAKF